MPCRDDEGFTGDFAPRKRFRVVPSGREHGGFLSGFAFACGAFIAAVAGGVLMLVFIRGWLRRGRPPHATLGVR